MARKLAEGEQAPPSWLDPIGKVVTGLMGKNEPIVAGMPGAVTGPQMTQAMKALESLRGYRFGPSSYGAAAIRELPTSLRTWAEAQWKNVGGLGKTQVMPLGSGSESTAVGVMPGREVLKIFRPESYTATNLSSGEQLPQTLLPTLQWGMAPTGQFGYMVQPYAQPISRYIPGEYKTELLVSPQRAQRMINYLLEQSQRAGRIWDDARYDNVGLWKGKPYILDAGSFTP